MTNQALDTLIREIDGNVQGQVGFWEFTVAGRRLYCITDESHNRMRVMTSVVEGDQLTPEMLRICMEANFDRALDARYCLNEDTLWSAFMHPLRSLQADLFRSACNQVAMLAENFGSSYSSGELRFGS